MAGGGGVAYVVVGVMLVAPLIMLCLDLTSFSCFLLSTCRANVD